MKKIIIYGGTFDPPTISHIETAKLALEKSGYDELWFLPCYKHAFKSEITQTMHRVHMLNHLLKNESIRIKVSSFEINNKGKYAIDTITQLKEKYPKYEFAWLIGADNAKDFRKWKDYKNILENIVMIIVDRFGTNKGDFDWLLDGKNIHITTPDKYPFNIKINSTQVRQIALKRLDNKDQWKSLGGYFITNEVLSYIENHNLYLNNVANKNIDSENEEYIIDYDNEFLMYLKEIREVLIERHHTGEFDMTCEIITINDIISKSTKINKILREGN